VCRVSLSRSLRRPCDSPHCRKHPLAYDLESVESDWDHATPVRLDTCLLPLISVMSDMPKHIPKWLHELQGTGRSDMLQTLRIFVI